LNDGLFACLARLRRGLFVFGFTATDGSLLAFAGDDLVKLSDLLVMLDNPRFQRKLYAP
jgi:hypothetical protein